MTDALAGARALLLEVAVPVPFAHSLTYRAPIELAPFLRPGVRVRVPVGKRSLVGVVWALPESAPEGFELREIDRLVDFEPALPDDLLELARFAAEYYLASPGDTVAAMLPSDLPGWGDRTVELTAAGVHAPLREAGEPELLELLLGRGRSRLSALLRARPDPALPALVERWLTEGRLREQGRSGSTRYLALFGLAAGNVEELRVAAGRSAAGRAVVDYLAALGRASDADEIRTATGASAAVLSRLSTLGVLLRTDSPRTLDLDRHLLGRDGDSRSERILTADQASALGELEAAIGGGFRRFLLQGVTGSGKSEVFFRLAEAVAKAGRSTIVLVPELALVPSLARAARERFGASAAILHSGLSAAERAQEWERIRRGEARLVVGARSALFAPIADLGLVVVDEEQDPAYKQDAQPRYQGRDLAIVRCQQAGAIALLASATPSLESRSAAERGLAHRLTLPTRIGDRALPEGILVDLREEPRVQRAGELAFSERLQKEIESALVQGEQVILLRNRRGYSPLLLCRACGEEFRCDACGLPRTFHRRAGRLVCHWCGSFAPAPAVCPSCSTDALEAIGSGTERVEEEVVRRFPGVAVGVLDRDTSSRVGGAAAILERFRSGETRILVGTQMLSKGHHFPEVALTAVLSADAHLGFPDFRAVERTYTLLTQLAGRGGRGERPGRVVVQTFHPDHYAIRAALAHDDAAFEAQEMRFRRLFDYPPFTRMALVVAASSDRDKAWERIQALARSLAPRAESDGLRLTGPAPAPLERLKGEWRFQLVLRSKHGGKLRAALAEALPARPDPMLTVDVDPYDLM